MREGTASCKQCGSVHGRRDISPAVLRRLTVSRDVAKGIPFHHASLSYALNSLSLSTERNPDIKGTSVDNVEYCMQMTQVYIRWYNFCNIFWQKLD